MAARAIGWPGWNVGVDMNEDITDKVDGMGDGPSKVAIEDADVDASADADIDGDDERPLVVVDEMGVGDYEQAGVVVGAKAEDNTREEVECVLIV